MTSLNDATDEVTATTEMVGSVGDFEPGTMKMAKVGDRRVVVACTKQGISAIDNACPHQGYGLVTGALDGDLVTCQWHNWKFSVTDGTCVVGEEDVEAHPVSIKGDEVWVTVTEATDAEKRERLWPSLRRGIEADYRGQIARDTARLLEAGADPAEIVWEGVKMGAPKVDWAMGHEMANAADCLAFVDMFEGIERTLPIAQALAGVAEETRDRAPYVPHDPDGSFDFLESVETERRGRAVASIRAKLRDGASLEEVRALIIEAVSRHHLSYGHGAIYTQKAFELLDRVGWEHADDLLPHLVTTLVFMTREDTLPYMRSALRAIDEVDVDALAATSDRRDTGWAGRDELVAAILEASDPPIGVAVEAAHAGAGVEGVLDAVSLAVSERMLRYDASAETDPDNNFRWLDISHGMTYARAARWAWQVNPSPASARLALFTVFLAYDTGRHERRAGVGEPIVGGDPTADLTAAVLGGNEADAVAVALAGDTDHVANTMKRIALSDAAGSFIVAAHLVKGSQAAWEEAHTTGSNLPLAAMARLAAAPRQERFVESAVTEAIDFVRTGAPPVR